MDWRYIAISESGKKNDIAVTDRLARTLLGLDGKHDRFLEDARWVIVKGTHVRLNKSGEATAGPKRLKKAVAEAGKCTMAPAEVRDLCKLDKRIYGRVTSDITTDDVVVTGERVQHVLDQHPEMTEGEAIKMMQDAVEKPDYLLRDKYKSHKNDTAIVMKKINDWKVKNKKGKEKNANMRLILRLATSKDKKGNKNSVITAIVINDKTFRKYLNEPDVEILYNREEEE